MRFDSNDYLEWYVPRAHGAPAINLHSSGVPSLEPRDIDVPDVDRGCRTKITTMVRDARKMFEGWAHGLHRVIFYGNHMEDTRRLGRMVGFDVVEEG